MAVQLDDYATLRNDANLVHYMRLESATATVGSNMTNTNSVTFIAGQFNNAAHFVKASSQSLDLASDLGITNGNITIIAWVKVGTAPSSGNYTGFVGKADGGTFVQYGLWYNNPSGTLQVWFDREKGGVANQGVQLNQTLTIDTWYQLAMTYDGTNVRGYIDGAEVTGSPVAASGDGSSAEADGYEIGTLVGNSGGAHTGRYGDHDVDDVAIFSRALSATEISDFYNATAAATPSGRRRMLTGIGQ